MEKLLFLTWVLLMLLLGMGTALHCIRRHWLHLRGRPMKPRAW